MYTITIVIPARNEANNLPLLLADVVTQQFPRGVKINAIQVYSDGSTDETVRVAKAVAKTNKLICVRAFSTSKGKAARLNQAFAPCKADAVVVLDADIRLPLRTTLQALVEPIRTKTAELSSAPVKAAQPTTWMEQMLDLSMQAKQRAYAKWHNGDNVYTCHGRIRAFSKKLYSQIQFQHSYSEDSFSYVFCKTSGFRYAYAPDAAITYQLPKTLHDHILQSERFFVSTDLLRRSFSESVVQQALALPKSILIPELLKTALRAPLLMSAYILITVYSAIHARIHHHVRSDWQMAASSK